MKIYRKSTGPERQHVSLYLPKMVWRRVKVMAALRGMTLQDFTTEALIDACLREHKQAGEPAKGEQ